MMRIASYNVEKHFALPKAFEGSDWSSGESILAVDVDVNKLFAQKGPSRYFLKLNQSFACQAFGFAPGCCGELL